MQRLRAQRPVEAPPVEGAQPRAASRQATTDLGVSQPADRHPHQATVGQRDALAAADAGADGAGGDGYASSGAASAATASSAASASASASAAGVSSSAASSRAGAVSYTHLTLPTNREV